MKLDAAWKSRIITVLRSDEPPQEDRGQGERLRRALENLRKQHQWGNISDDEYRREREILIRQLKVHTVTLKPTYLSNLDRSANFLEDLPALWLHPGVTHEEREAWSGRYSGGSPSTGKSSSISNRSLNTFLFLPLCSRRKK